MSITTESTEVVGLCTVSRVKVTEGDRRRGTGIEVSEAWNVDCDECGEDVATLVDENTARTAAAEHACEAQHDPEDVRQSS